MVFKRDLSLDKYIHLDSASDREAKQIEVPVKFSIYEIKRHFDEGMASIKAQYRVANSLLEEQDTENCKIIWRSQVVFAEGQLDYYLHEISKYCLYRMFTGQWKKSEKYASFMVPMGKVEEAINAKESKDWFFNYLNERFSRDVFLSKESMNDQLNLIGIGFTQVMVRAFPSDKEETSRKNGGEIVSRLFNRRNAIAHQNDRSHASAEQTDITEGFVVDCISNITAIVESIDKIVKEKDSLELAN